jgi:uncharacterized protein
MFDSLRLDLAGCPDGCSQVRIEAPGEQLDLGDFALGVESPVVVELTVDRSGEHSREKFSLRGTAIVVPRLECSRCLIEFSLPMKLDCEWYVEVGGEEAPDDDTCVAMADLSAGLDISALLRELVLTELPMAPRCREDCAGLCPVCGINLNTGTCSCEKDDKKRTVLGELLSDKPTE